MTSSVFFKFKSQKEPSRVEFDGTGISVFELKRDIIVKSGLGDGTEFDLAIYNEDGNEEYDDDTEIIPRSTSVIARRLPPTKPGAGRAARYVTGKMPVNAKNSRRQEQSTTKSTSKATASSNAAAQMNSAMTEEERMAAMFQVQSEQWSAQQDEMASQTPVFNGRPGNKKGGPPVNVPDHEPPTGYICYRCGEKGHWIQVCPTNDDPEFDNKPRVKRTTGIPRSFLKTVAKPSALANDGTIDDTKTSGIMVNAEGEFVIAEPDRAAWDKFQEKTKSSAAAQKAAASGDKDLQERGLECSIDKRMFIDPMKTPCCEKTYCNDCITDALIVSDFTCPGCGTEEVLIDNLTPDQEMGRKISVYLEEQSAAKKEKARSASPPAQIEKNGTPVAEVEEIKNATKSPSPAPKSPAIIKSPLKSLSPTSNDAIPVKPPTSPAASKKRPAEESLENPKIPKGPKAMQQQQQQQTQQQMMNGFPTINGFPGMPSMPSMPFDMNMMNQIGMNPMMMGMNPMMGMNMMGGMNGMNGMNAMNSFNMNGQFPNMNGMGMGMGNGMYNNMGFGGNMNGMNGMGGNNAGGGGVFQNQQQNTFAAGGPVDSEEDNAYFRKPVNPYRHQGKQRRARPSDYREV